MEVNLRYEENQVLEAIVREASCRLIDKYDLDLRRIVQDRVAGAIEAQVNTIVEDALIKVFTPVDEFGDPKGEPTTVKAILAKKAKSFLEEKVDNSGKAQVSHYQSLKPRVEYLIGKLFEEALDHSAKSEIKKIADQAKEKAHLEVAKLIVAQIQKG